MPESAPPVLNVASLVAPIREGQPCGTLREHGEDNDLVVEFAQLGIDFDMARRIERAKSELEMLNASQRKDALVNAQGRPDSPAETPPWKRIIQQSDDILAKHSKDMRVVAWLVEAACRVHGFVGLRDALDVCAQLIERYGEQLFPLGDSPADKLYRYGPIKNLNGSSSLMSAIRQVPFIAQTMTHYTGYELAKYIQTLPIEEQNSHRDIGKLSLDDFTTTITECSRDVIEKYTQDMNEALAAAERVDKLLREVSGPQIYTISKVIDQLTQIGSWFRSICSERPAEAAEVTAEPTQTADSGATTTVATASPAQAGGGVSLTFKTRDEALASLLKVAKFFRSTEPHSPLSYVLEQAVRWGRMELPDLLKDLVSDSSVLTEVFRRTGIKEKEENN